MTEPGLLQALDYILNKSDSASIEVLSEAVVRRRRNMHLFNAVAGMPDPEKFASQITEKINEGLGSGIEKMRQSIREMIFRIVKVHAPELAENQLEELCEIWLPDINDSGKNQVPPDVLYSMIEQFISFSHGTMKKSVDEALRKEIGAWPSRYWKSFSPVVRQLITDYLKNKITEKDFFSRFGLAVGLVQ